LRYAGRRPSVPAYLQLNKPRKTLICLLLGALTLALFLPSVGFNFVNYDDPDYVTQNPAVQGGLNGHSVAWAFTSSHADNWHPLTWMSHMLDCQFYGLKPAGHHLTNVLFHAANAILLFLVLARMTGTTWRSFLVAALFAWHPLHVESVAWVAERKDVLSTFFGLLTIGAYAGYASEDKSKSKICYGLALVLFALGLMAKPMLVTLPFVFLLLDYWPLRRTSFSPGENPTPATVPPPRGITRAAVGENSFLRAVLCVLRPHHRAQSIASIGVLPLGSRMENALVAYLKYLGKLAWPSHLAFFYPHNEVIPLWQMAFAAIVLLGVSVMAVIGFRRRPYLLVGWFWFLGTLVPVIGLLQVGALVHGGSLHPIFPPWEYSSLWHGGWPSCRFAGKSRRSPSTPARPRCWRPAQSLPVINFVAGRTAGCSLNMRGM